LKISCMIKLPAKQGILDWLCFEVDELAHGCYLNTMIEF
jgi:hypothetical protein